MESIDNLLDKTTSQFVGQLAGQKPIYELSVTDARQVLLDIQSDTSYLASVDITSGVVAGTDIGDTEYKIYRPKNNQAKLPVIFYCHGGGWILGNSQTHGRLMADLANRTGAAVVYAGYTAAPDFKFPYQLVQIHRVLKYIVDNNAKLNIDTDQIVLMGDSVGGNMATIMALIVGSKIKILAQVLLYPVTSSTMVTESYTTYANGPWLSRKSMQWFFDAYMGDGVFDTAHKADHQAEHQAWLNSALISPLNVPLQHLATMPPTLIVFGEHDPLRDEVKQYAHKLMQAGVNVTAAEIMGTIHDFLMLDPLKKSPPAVGAMILIVGYIRGLFVKI